MNIRDVRLSDRYDLNSDTVLLSGTQALVRLALIQRARDEAAGLNTAGYVTGYRGSPLGAVDGTFTAAGKQLTEAHIKFQPGLNEDLAATALWGSQQAESRNEGKYDGVFGLWYGKGPGVDRCGDVFRHANLAGSSRHGGVLAAMGDDHTGESSTTLHQSEMAMMDAYIPVLSPAGVQELLDFGVLGWAMSRYSGCWVGLKCMKDTVEATSVVDGRPDRVTVNIPTDHELPEGGLNIRVYEEPHVLEERLHDHKRPAVLAFARANNLDKRVDGQAGARIGIVSSGKSWNDTRHALELLGIDEAMARQIGLTTYKVGLVWPLEPTRLLEWAEGLEQIIVVEEKRPIIETQLKEILFGMPGHPRVIGHKDANGQVLFSMKKGLDPVTIARGIAGQVVSEGLSNDTINERLASLNEAVRADNAPEIAQRAPWFCAGCPHNTGTKLQDGARAYSGIGCHYMVQWMDRETLGYTHMGGEGANWIGEAPFSTRPHVFQNLGDGTYNHSGILAIRAAIGSGVNMTYKVLYNDAVAMTGGQHHDGGIDARRVVDELLGIGVKRLEIVADEKEDVPPMPAGLKIHPRSELLNVQRELEKVPGVTALVYIQTCAAEKRRRRKRGQFPDPDKRVFINPSVCEGCGDCGVQSNCVAILPLETPLGRKREIDQSACNKDFSCLNGFCPSFVTVEGAIPKGRAAVEMDLPALPDPALPTLDRSWNILITGVGGTGVVTVGALITMAAHLEGKGAAEMQMAGLAQKGGAVAIHCRVAPTPQDISAIRISIGEADAVIGGDLVVTAAPKTLAAMERGRTRAICNTQEIITGEFTHNTEFSIPTQGLELAIERRVGAEAFSMIEATKLAEHLLGDAIFSNVMMLGAAWQAGMVPLSIEALRKAIELNGAAVQGNLRAFEIGRWAVAFPDEAREAIAEDLPVEETFAQKLARREEFLTGYQNAAYAARYRKLVDRALAVDQDLGEAVAEGYFKLLSYKDEYEVARLHTQTLDEAIEGAFDNAGKVTFHLAPPILGRKDSEGRPVKTEFGPWIRPVFRMLARMKGLRGTPLDLFGYSAERRMERQLIADYETLVDELLAAKPGALPTAVELARLPRKIRGFGHVKERNAKEAAEEQAALLAELRAGGSAPRPMAAE
ncbi:indolepyruvate ferredoxin oxidoreductase family protein [Rhodobacteraceae bacterium NNCM2]|nr:indolepyruvate ferredoxin oxidoreductase family protein [Coraliihabitans acroporae]